MPLLALRHAVTAWNAEGRLQGRSDQPLSPTGMAAAAGWRLPAEPHWRVYSSPLARARQTAAAMGLDPQPEAALIEMDWGAWEGRRLATLRQELGPALAAEEARGLDFRPPEGESPREVRRRLRPFLALLAERGEPAALVTHKGVLRALLSLACGWDILGRPPARIEQGRALVFRLAGDGALSLEGSLDLARAEAPS